MAAPLPRFIDGVTNTVATTSLAVTRAHSSLNGSRLYAIACVNDNSVTVTADFSDPNYVPIASLPGGKLTRTAGVDRMSLWIYEYKNAGIQGVGTGGTWSFTNSGSPFAVEGQAYLVEITGADPTADAERIVTSLGSATAISVGPYSAPPINDEILHFAVVTNLNYDIITDPGSGLMGGFTLNTPLRSKTVSGDSLSADSAILYKQDTTGSNQSFTVNLVGSNLTRNFAGVMLAIPSAPPGAGTFFGMDDTNDGKIHRACSLHYYPGGFNYKPSNPSPLIDYPGLWARESATLFDIMVANTPAMPAAGQSVSFGGDKFAQKTPEMVAIKPNIQLGSYNKSAEISEGVTAFPNNYYAHQSPWPSGAKITIFNPNIYVAQASVVAGQSTYNDPRGWAATSYKEQRARLAWWNIDQYNLRAQDTDGSGGQLNVAYLDTMYNSSYKGIQVDPATNIAYTRPNWINQQVFPIGDETMSRGSGRAVWANVISTGDTYYTGNPASGNGLDHCDGGVAENWIRSNYGDVTVFPTEAVWQHCCDMHIDANSRGKGVWCVINIGNSTAKGSVPSGWKNPSAATLEKWRRFTMATYMFAKRSKSWFEFVQDVTVKPWDEDHPYYHLDLGAPTDAWASASAGKTSGVYRRRFQRGIALINPTTAVATYIYDRDYRDPGYGQPGAGVNDNTGTAGATITLQPNDAIILTTPPAGPPNLSSPTGAFISPGADTSENPTLVVVSATDADGDGIAGVTISYTDVNGLIISLPASFIGGNWQALVPMLDGINSLTAVITDGNTSPLNTTINMSTTFTAPPAGSGLPQEVGVYDLAIDDLGLMLYRADDDSNPDRVYKTEPADSTFSPVFIDRTNIQGDLGDNVQDFFMSFVQRDWSGGMGQRFFRQSGDQERSFWDCRGVDVTSEPGSVKIGVKQGNNVPPGAQTNWCNGDYFTHPGKVSTTVPPQQGLLRVDNSGTSAAVVYHYNTDGSANWLTQHTTSATVWNDCVDLCVGDDGNLYCLEGGTGNTATIHSIGLPGTATTLAWDNSTGVSGSSAQHIAYFQGFAYVANRVAQVKRVTTTGSVAPQSITHDFGGGHIIDMLATSTLLYVLYCSNRGQFSLWSYDGTNFAAVANLPAGWRYQTPHQTSLDVLGNTVSNNKTHALAYADGVIYASGLLPAKDYVQSQRRTTSYRQALWFAAGGNSGVIWASEYLVNDWRRASGGALGVIRGDQIVWLDGTNGRLMKYDPAQGAVMAIAPFANKNPTNINDDQVVSGALASTDTTLTVTSASTSALVPGTVLTTTFSTERVLVVSQISTTQYIIIRGYQDTTAVDATFPNGATLLVDPPLPPPHRLAYDPYNDRMMIVWYPSGPAGWAPQAALQGHRLSFFEFSSTSGFLPADAGLVISSEFDFNSSLEKIFHSVSIDGHQTQFANRVDEVPGTFDVYYKLDGTFNALSDAGVQVAGRNVSPGDVVPIFQRGRSITVAVALNPGTPTASQPISQGPVLTRLSVKGVPVLTGFQTKNYQVALFEDLPTASGTVDPNQQIAIMQAIIAKIKDANPVLVTDVTNAPDGSVMVFQPENCKFREMRPGEWVAYLQLREV